MEQQTTTFDNMLHWRPPSRKHYTPNAPLEPVQCTHSASIRQRHYLVTLSPCSTPIHFTTLVPASFAPPHHVTFSAPSRLAHHASESSSVSKVDRPK